MTLIISRKNRYIRFFIWAWGVENPHTLNLCKLFWGTVFLPLFPVSFMVNRPNGTFAGLVPRWTVYWLILAIFYVVRAILLTNYALGALGVWGIALVAWTAFLGWRMRQKQEGAIEKFEKGDFIEQAKSSKPILVVSIVLSLPLALPAAIWVAVFGLLYVVLFMPSMWAYDRFLDWRWERRNRKCEINRTDYGFDIVSTRHPGTRKKPDRQNLPSAFWNVLIRLYKSFKEKTCYIVKVK